MNYLGGYGVIIVFLLPHTKGFSTMPNGLSDGMTLQDVADILTFLEARREEKK